MSSRHWMPLYVNDFRVKTLDLTTEQIGAYLLLIMLTWLSKDGALPNDFKQLRRALASCAAPMHGHMFNRLIPPLLERYFELGQDDKWRNPRVTMELFKAAKRTANAKQMARKRWAPHNEFKGLPNAKAMQVTTTKKESSTSSESETRTAPTHAAGKPNGSGEQTGWTASRELLDSIFAKGWKK